MAHVRADHNQVVVFDNGRDMIFPAAMNRDVFANAIAIPDSEHAARLMLLQVLGRAADDCTFTNFVVAADRGSRLNGDSGGQSAIVADDGPGFDNTKRPNADVSPEFSAS